MSKINRRSFMQGLVGTAGVAMVTGSAVAGDAFDAKPVKQTYVDSYRTPIAIEIGEFPPKDYGPVTEESVRAELADKHYIAIPSRKSLLSTPELRAKKEILMQLVYTGQVSIDFSVARPNDETSETCLVFFNSKPHIYAETRNK